MTEFPPSHRSPGPAAPSLRAGARSVLAVVGAFLVLALGGSEAQAQNGLDLEIRPVFGVGCTARGGTAEVVIAISNRGPGERSGTVTVEPLVPPAALGVRTVQAAPFSVLPRESVYLRLPIPSTTGDSLSVVARDRAQRMLLERTVTFTPIGSRFLVDATPNGRIALALKGENVEPTVTTPPGFGRGSGVTPPSPVTACAAPRIPQTGDVVLPRYLAGYSDVALIVADARTVMSLPPAELRALGDYVLTGGTLVVIPERADQLRARPFEDLLGLGITAMPIPPFDTHGSAWLAMLPETAAEPMPRGDILAHVESFRGGRLRTDYLATLFRRGAPGILGASADYGRGHVHVLSFDLSRPQALEDPWSLWLLQRVYETSGTNAVPLALLGEPPAETPPAVRRVLDPNESFRPGLGAAVIFLLFYAILAGPVSFRRAARANRPALGLALLPLFSVAGFASIVALGGVTRGLQARARRFGVIELPAGVNRGPIRRYHGYYSSEGGGMSVSVDHGDHRLTVDPSIGTGFVSLEVGPHSTRLRGLARTPWSPLVVREEGMESIGGTVALQRTPQGLVVVNHMPFDLRDVIVLDAGALEGWSFASIPTGATRRAKNGTALPSVLLSAVATGSFPDPGLATGTVVSGADNLALHPGWSVANAFGGGIERVRDWDALVGVAPEVLVASRDVPQLLARWVAPTADDRDGHLPVDRDVEFIHVTGWGGAP